MVSYTPSASKLEDIKYFGYAVYRYPELDLLDQNDTVTCSEFTDDVDLSQSLLVNNASGAEVTTTIALNVVTVTGAATDLNCTLFVFGRREL